MLKQILIVAVLVVMQTSSPMPGEAAETSTHSSNNSKPEPQNHENTAQNPALLNKQALVQICVRGATRPVEE
jgi:hypothetical protein